MPLDPPRTTFVKGVGFNSAMAYAESKLGDDQVRRCLDALADEHGSYDLHRLSSARVPLRAAEAAWRVVAALRGGDRPAQREFFQGMGVYIADTNLRGIYKTLLSLVGTPELLAKRVPSLWSTYFVGLEVTIDLEHLERGRMASTVTGFVGAPHIGEMAEGWLAYALRLVGGKEVEVYESTLSAGAPHPEPTMRFHMSWRR